MSPGRPHLLEKSDPKHRLRPGGGVSATAQFSNGHPDLRRHGLLLPTRHRSALAHPGSDGSGGAQRPAEHRRRQPCRGHQRRLGNPPDQRGPRQPGRTAPGEGKMIAPSNGSDRSYRSGKSMRKRRRKNLPSSAARSQPTELIRPIPPILPRVPGPAVKRRAPAANQKAGGNPPAFGARPEKGMAM